MIITIMIIIHNFSHQNCSDSHTRWTTKSELSQFTRESTNCKDLNYILMLQHSKCHRSRNHEITKPWSVIISIKSFSTTTTTALISQFTLVIPALYSVSNIEVHIFKICQLNFQWFIYRITTKSRRWNGKHRFQWLNVSCECPLWVGEEIVRNECIYHTCLRARYQLYCVRPCILRFSLYHVTKVFHLFHYYIIHIDWTCWLKNRQIYYVTK